MIKVVEVFSDYIIGGNRGVYTILRSDEHDNMTSISMETHELVNLKEEIEKVLEDVQRAMKRAKK